MDWTTTVTENDIKTALDEYTAVAEEEMYDRGVDHPEEIIWVSEHADALADALVTRLDGEIEGGMPEIGAVRLCVQDVTGGRGLDHGDREIMDIVATAVGVWLDGGIESRESSPAGW